MRKSVEVGVFRRGGSLQGKILGWRVTFHANICGPLDAGMVVLQLCRCNFHTEKLCSRLFFDWSWQKHQKIAFWATLSRLRGNVRTPSIARWKARGRLYIRHYWTFFAISYGWDVTSGNLSKSTFFEGGWVTFSTAFRGKGASPTNYCWCKKTRVIAISCGIKISAIHHLVLSQYTRLTNGRTDGRTDRIRQQYRALHYMLHGKNQWRKFHPILVTDVFGFVDVLIRFWVKKVKLRDTSGNDPKTLRTPYLNKKFSYHRDAWNSHSRSLKVISCGANRRGIYDFLLALKSIIT